jgi:hypothetical protein
VRACGTLTRVSQKQVSVMPGLVPGLHVFLSFLGPKDVDGRDKPRHDENKNYLRAIFHGMVRTFGP